MPRGGTRGIELDQITKSPKPLPEKLTLHRIESGDVQLNSTLENHGDFGEKDIKLVTP